MSIYRHIVLGLDLNSEEEITLIRKAQELAKTFNAELTVVHAIEHINSYGIGQAYPGVLEIEEELAKGALAKLNAICAAFNIPPENQVVNIGSTKIVILETVQQKNADLIIIGSHGRHGLALLLGSTADSLLHQSSYDVLALHLSKQN